jgi:hypothetical protein
MRPEGCRFGDDNSDRTVAPLVNYLLIAASIAAFVLPGLVLVKVPGAGQRSN